MRLAVGETSPAGKWSSPALSWGPLAVCVLLVFVGMGQCRGQSAGVASGNGDCVPNPDLPAFEVAAIAPVAEKDRGVTNVGQFGMSHFELRNASLSFLLNFTFDIQQANFIGAPRALDDALFNVEVKATDGTILSYEALKPRMQQMLQQRFCLQAHKGIKEVAGYALVVAKGGPKVMPDKSLDEHASAYIWGDGLSATQIKMSDLATMLASSAGRPVQDQTGLQGKYTIRIQFAPPAEAESSLPSIFTALKEQLGLELRPVRVPVTTLVIEHVNLVPTEN
jgi:uncharacterized protein (TIGR03435 family)